jgi:hypothetical protein
MDSDGNHQPQFELPRPDAAGNSLPRPEIPSQKSAENVGASAELQGSSPAQNPLLAQIAPPPIQPNLQPVAPTASQVSGTNNAPAFADDVDLIEKEWVVRAKDIVERTKNDPHLQNKEMNKFKAEYVKKRYNKELKLGED